MNKVKRAESRVGCWPQIALGEVLVPRHPEVFVDPTTEYQFAGVYSFGRGVFRGAAKKGREFSYSRLTRLNGGDFTYPKLMAWEGAFGVVPPECDGCHVSPEFPVFAPRLDLVDPRFLNYYFRNPRIWEEVSGGSIGTNVRRRRLHPNHFLRSKIALPPLAEQRRIISRIEGLSEGVLQAQRLREDAEDDANALLIGMAHRADLDANAKKRAGWKRQRLDEVIQLVDELHPVKPEASYPNLGIYSFGRGLFPKPPIQGFATSAKVLRRVKAGQFIYSRLFAFEGAYGRVTAEFDGAYVSQEYPTFCCRPGVTRSEFLVAYFKPAHIWKTVAAGSKGLGDRRQRVQPKEVLAHELWVPPIAWQDHLAEVQSQIDALQRLQSETAAELAALLPSILDKALKGELL